MSLNIKDPETHKLAEELARLKGTSVAEAVNEALREKVAALRPPAEPKAPSADEQARLIADLTEMARRIREAMGPEALAVDHGDLLYDEKTGLPR